MPKARSPPRAQRGPLALLGAVGCSPSPPSRVVPRSQGLEQDAEARTVGPAAATRSADNRMADGRAEDLRIVPEPFWQAATIGDRRRRRRRWALAAWRGQPGDLDGRGVRRHYFLTGFGRCEACGGSMQAVSRASDKPVTALRLRHVLESRLLRVRQRAHGRDADCRSGGSRSDSRDSPETANH